jgi:hypothetical protein
MLVLGMSISTHTMLTSPDLSRVDLENLGVDARVVQQPQGVVPNVYEPVEEALIQSHAHRNGLHHLNMHLLALLEEAEHVRLPAGQVLVVVPGPLVRVLRLALPPDLEALLEVRRRGAHLFHLAHVGELADLFAPGCRVAPVCLGGGPSQRQLGVVLLREELGGAGEDVAQGGCGDGVVLEVDEAGGLEAVEYGLCRLEALCRRPFQERREIDQLYGSKVRAPVSRAAQWRWPTYLAVDLQG